MKIRSQWYSLGACIDNPEFEGFPSMKETRVIARSKSICRSCPVRKECWADAYSGHVDEGIFGGSTADERRLMGAILNIPPRATVDTIVMMLRS